MAAKHLLFEARAREKLLAGATVLYDALRVTLGPKSKSVLIGRRWGEPIVCNDGVTIARELELEDAEEDLGARMIRQAAARTGDAVGDGTTTAAILAYGIFADGVRNVAAGASAIDLKRGLDRGVLIVRDALRSLSRPVQTLKERAQVATVSAHNDPSIGELVAEAVEKVGPLGAITVEDAKGTETALEIVEGMQFDRGYLSPYFITRPERRACELEDALVLITERKLSNLNEVLPLLEMVLRQSRPLLVVADEVEADVLATLVLNRLRGALACCAVRAPGYGDYKKAQLRDLAVLTGGEVIAAELGQRIEGVGLEQLGRARRIIVDNEQTTVIGGAGQRETIDARIAELRSELERTKSSYDRERLEQRLSKLAGGVAIVRVGAPSEAELKSRREGFEDSISTTKAAMAEGFLPGGGLALLRAADKLVAEEQELQGDARTGCHILRRALEMPLRQLAENSGVDGGVVVEHVRGGSGNDGFDAARGEYLDLVEAGIIDATKVVRVALENAVSVASVMLLTEATLTEQPEAKQRPRGEEAGFEAGL